MITYLNRGRRADSHYLGYDGIIMFPGILTGVSMRGRLYYGGVEYRKNLWDEHIIFISLGREFSYLLEFKEML